MNIEKNRYLIRCEFVKILVGEMIRGCGGVFVSELSRVGKFI